MITLIVLGYCAFSAWLCRRLHKEFCNSRNTEKLAVLLGLFALAALWLFAALGGTVTHGSLDEALLGLAPVLSAASALLAAISYGYRHPSCTFRP